MITGRNRRIGRKGKTGPIDGERDIGETGIGHKEAGGERAAAIARVRAHLKAAGVTDEEVDQAVADDVLDLLAVDRLLVPSVNRYTEAEVSELTGLPIDMLQRFWRALGFLDTGDEAAFTDMDIEAVNLFKRMLSVGVVDIDVAVQLARVIGVSMARIAEAEVIPGVSAESGSEIDNVLVADAFASVADETLPTMAWLLEFVWRRHVQAATRRTMMRRTHGHVSGSEVLLSVGFADMVGFTLLSQHLSSGELAEVVRRFEEISHDIVTSLGGRIVKMIGDEAMFVVDDPVGAARIGLGLAEAYGDDELLSDVRVGLAFGSVLLHDGDYYGPTVNLAHRIVNIANPGTVIVSDDLHAILAKEAGDEFASHPLRPRILKDLGRVQLWWCGRAGQEADGLGEAADRRRNVRWERLGEILRDFDDLREAGERLLAGARRDTDAERGGSRREAGFLRIGPLGHAHAHADGHGRHDRDRDHGSFGITTHRVGADHESPKGSPDDKDNVRGDARRERD